MADLYIYPVLFDCTKTLEQDQKKKIENYFKIQRKSGGGDCGSVTHISGTVYRIAFKDRQAQQRVLQKSEHVLTFGERSLTLTVREDPEPRRSSPVTTSTTTSALDSATAPQHRSIPVTNPPSSGEHHVKLNRYLLSYFKDCPQAGNELNKELSALGCSAKLHPEDEKVSVWSVVQPPASEQVKKWEDEVDSLFKRIGEVYHCHFEVDSPKITIFLQSCSACPTADGVKVYSELGMAVVVGERSKVNARLKHMMDSHVKARGSSLSKNHSRTHRMGEAKLRLLWKEIENSLQREFPGMKVRQEAGQLVLEGSAEEILKAGGLIAVTESLVLERTISDLSPHLLDFLRKAYGGLGKLRDFLGCGDQVELELKAKDLCLFSQSADRINKTLKELQDKFKEVKLSVPNCSDVPSELRLKLQSKVNEMNQTGGRVQVLFGSDSIVHLLGHTKEVEELNEVVGQFILDQTSTEGQIVLPYPELGQNLPEFLRQHGFDHSGVTLSLSNTSSTAVVVLEGPLNRVTQVKNRLGQFISSLCHEKISIDMPGAVRYFESSSGRDALLKAGRDHKCLVQLEENTALLNLPSLSEENTVVASYLLLGGLQVLVCQGDITRMEADVLVNAANEDLDHRGGVAEALSKAGGPQVQKESSVLVKQTGKIVTGSVVVTTGGNLKCKKLLHAVGPIQGTAGGREKILVEQCVENALDLAAIMGFRSIAMPCISSGVYGVPVRDSAEAMVTAVKKFGSQGSRSLNTVMLIDNRGEVVRSMQDMCDRLLRGMSTRSGVPRDVEGVRVEVIEGAIETQQVDILVSPMDGHEPLSTAVGKAFSRVVGPQMAGKFHAEARGTTLPGDTVLVRDLPGLSSKALFFLNLVQWDKKPNGTAVQALRQGISQILVSSENQGFRSVGFPVLGTGALLRFPHAVASRVLMEAIRDFEQNRTSRTPFLVRIVVYPNDKDSSKAFQSAQQTLHLKGFTNNVDPDQASFYQYVSAFNGEVTATLGRVKLQMVQGDITHERTDVIVNTTDFSNNQSGVSHAILTAAGPSVQAELKQVGIPTDSTCTTRAGWLGCNEIFHATFNCDHQKIYKNCKKILKHCETKGYTSVAFPAINTGIGGMDCAAACKAMLDGMASAITELNPKCLSLIRIVILLQPVFQVFRSELENRFGQMAPPDTLTGKIKKHLKFTSKSSSVPPDIISSKPQPVIISVICCSSDIVRTIKTALEANLQQLLVEREVELRCFSRLDVMELAAVQTNIRIYGISLQLRKRQSADGNMSASGARARSGSTEEVYVLRGLKEDVLSVTELVNKALQKALQEQEEENMALNVKWFIQDQQETWREFGLHENYWLEKANEGQRGDVDVTAPDGMNARVNLKTLEATNTLTGMTYKVKRIQTNISLELPEHWEPMYGENFKRVELNPNSKEFKDVAQGFLKTAQCNIQKIERIQNLHLWQGFAACRQGILAKNGVPELGEKLLYHGTSEASCNSIARDKFDRRYAGKHAAKYGNGVYFAVTAKYSASYFCPVDSTGLKRLYAARVLTGRYTLGKEGLLAPPPRGSDPNDRFDSMVDNQQRPNMFVIFHDNQAYPEYLIIFK